MKDECINCGAWKGLHHYETNQCPRNGQEAPLGKLQKWDNTVYQEISTIAGVNYVEALLAQNAEQAATIARLTDAEKALQGEMLIHQNIMARQIGEIQSLQNDKKLADMAWTDNQAALKAQAAEIAQLTAKLSSAASPSKKGVANV